MNATSTPGETQIFKLMIPAAQEVHRPARTPITDAERAAKKLERKRARKARKAARR